MYEYDWKSAERHFRYAMASEQEHWHVRAWYSCFHLFPLGRLAEARQQAEQVVADNPLSQICHWDLAIVLEGLGLESEAGAASVAYTFYHFVLGEIDSALEGAGKALDQRNFMLISNFLRPFERGLSKSPAWPAMLAKARLTPALA